MGALEPLLVGLIVFVCAVFSVWRLMSLRLQLRMLDALSRLPPAAGGGWVTLLRRRMLARLSGGCGACAGAVRGPGNAAPIAGARSLNQKPAVPRR